MKKVMAIISLLLCMIVVVQSLPMSAYAEVLTGEADSVDSEQSSDTEVTVEEETEKIVYIVGEDETQRDETTKVFRMSDGSYTAAVYPTQVHYEEDGEMKEIDNTLQSVDGDRFETKAGPVKISVPSSLSDEDAVEYSDGEHSVMFRLDTEKAAKGTRKAKEKKNKKINELSEAIALQDMADEDFEKIYGKTKDESAYLDNIDGAIEEHNQLMMTSEKLGSQITYGSVFNDTDLRYTVTGTTLKEEIILKTSAGIQKKYEFIIGSETLIPVLMDDNSVQLCDSDGNKVFEINSPYMYDAAGEISEDIKVSIKKNSDGTYTYTLKPDKKWLEDEERVYPIVIDPPISDSTITGVTAVTGVFGNVIGTLDAGSENTYLKVGNRYSGDGSTPEVQSMIYSPLPTVLTKGSTKIINAKLRLVGYRGGLITCGNGIQINAYKITSGWNYDDSNVLVLGSDGLADYSDVLDYACVNDTTTSYENSSLGITWDITEAVQDWHEGDSTNNGIALRATGITEGIENFARFYGAGNSSAASNLPHFIYTYRDLRGVEDYWTFTSMGAGRFGTIGVNNFNGNPVITQPLVSSSGNNMPVSVSLIYSYNSQDSGKSGFGNWRTNYHMNIETCDHTFKIGETVIANYKYCFVDSDGTRHYLKEEGSEHKDEDGLGLTMTVLEGVTDHLYLLETKDKTKYKFDHYGRLVYIEDSNGNWNRICFVGADPSKQVIDYIVEGNKELTSTMQTSFEYGVWDTTIESPHGNKAIVSFTSTDKNIVFGFCYEDTHWESRTGATQIRWDGNGFPLAIYDGYGHRTYIESSIVNGVGRVTGMSYGTGNSCLVLENAEPALDMNNTLQRFTFDYNTNYTTITDIDGRAASYQFNNYGLTVGVVDHTTSWAQNYEYGVANNQNKGYENKLTLASKTIAPSENRAAYPGFDEADSINNYSVYPETAAITKTYVSDRGNTDNGVMKLEKNEGDQTATFISQKMSGLEVGNYTLSMYVSTYGTTLSGEGIVAQISANNSSGYRASSVSSAVTYTDIGKWTRIQTTIEIVAGDTSVDIGVYFPADTCGLVYVDDIQIECNRSGGSLNDSLSGAGSFNLLENTTFAPASNTVRSCWSGGAIVSYDRTSDAPTAVRRYATFNDDPAYANYAKKIQQSVHISGSGNEGDIFIAGCWAKVNSVPLDTNGSRGGHVYATLLVKFYDENDLHVKTEHISCNTAIEDWQFLMMKIVAPANFAKVVYCFDYSNNEGTAQIATPFLYKETYGQSYTYDESGNLISSTDAAEKMATFAYQDDALTSSVSPTGSKYLYTREDETQNIMDAYSFSGQLVELGYNESGDGTSMYITDHPFKGSLANGESVNGYLVNAKTGHTLGAFGVSLDSNIYVGNNWSKDYQLMGIYAHGNNIYTIRMANSVTLGLTSKDLGNGDEYFQLGSLPYYDQGTIPVESLFRIIPNGDGSYRILTGYSGYEKCIKMVENKFDDNIYKIAANSAYDEDDLSNKWYIFAEGEDLTITTSAEYSTDQNYLLSSTDQAGNTTTYEYTAGLLTRVNDPRDVTTTYTYDEMRRTTSVSSALNDVSYTYYEDQVTKIGVDGDNVVYGFTYDDYGRNTSVSVGNGTDSQTLATYEFTGQNMTKQTYGNGVFVNFTYDSVDRLNRKWYNNSENYVEYLYNPNGYLYRMIDGIAGRSTSYEYDLAGRNVASTVTDTSEYDLVASGTTSYADGTGLVDKQTTTIYGANNTVAKHLTYLYGYGTPTSSAGPEAISGLAVNGEQYLYSYDTLGRLITRKTSIGSEDESLNLINQTNTGKREEYTYLNNSDGTTTTLVKSFRDMLGVLHTYEYDGNGNITSETIGEGSNVEYKTYYYDSQNRLTRYNDSGLNITVKYVYDARGNITYINEYVYTTASDISNLIPTKTTPFSYGNTTWRDLLTNINGTTITYDSIGNPLKWTDNRTLTWENGRQLKSVNKNGSGTTYMYNGDGLRTEKWGDRTTQYIILDGTYLGEKTTFYGGTTYLITYIYGAEGSVIGLDVNGTAYYFVKNLQGDVTSIIDVNGNILANYSYDAYGYSMGVTDGNGNEVTSATHIANLNPFRYRGYMYDQETGFYYLRSRYYDPAVCRFLNADGLTTTGQGFDGNNMFAYCGNNPVNRYDPLGTSYESMSISALEVLIAGMKADVVNNKGNPYNARYTNEHIFKLSIILKKKKDTLALEEERKRRELTVWPTNSKTISSGFGDRILNGVPDYHKGVDILPMGDKDIVSCMYGTVTEVGYHSSMGNYLRIKSDKYTITYMHLESSSVYLGQTVYAGDFVGTMGNTGYSFGTHLHFEVWDINGVPIDPTKEF